MKLPLVLLALYIGFLSCFPCQDAPARAANRISAAANSAQHNGGHKDMGGDFCSPFCTCSCCSTVNIPPMTFGYILSLPQQVSAEEFFDYKVAIDQGKTGLIWQPPRHV